MKDADKIPFNKWMSALKTLAINDYGFSLKAVNRFDDSDWVDFYNEGLSAKDAFETDLKNLY